MSSSVIIGLRSSQIRDAALKAESCQIKSCDNGRSKFDTNNLHLLSLRRGESDRLLPGMHVFPGGHLCDSDSSPAWIELYKSFGYNERSFESLSTGGGIELFPEYKVGNYFHKHFLAHILILHNMKCFSYVMFLFSDFILCTWLDVTSPLCHKRDI